MGIAHQPQPVKLIVAIMFAPGVNLDAIRSELARHFNATIERSHGPVPFNWSSYYDDEMGGGLQKAYFSFTGTIDRGLLPDIKTFTNGLESKLSVDGNRTVNIDPGYLARDKLVLATTKDFYHRIYLRDGIFAEVTLHYRQGAFRFFSWTYPDYKEESFLAFLEKARAVLVKDLRDSVL